MEIKNCYIEGKLWKVLDIERKGLGVVSKEYIPKGISNSINESFTIFSKDHKKFRNTYFG